MDDSRCIEVEELLQHVGWVRALAAHLARDGDEADDIAQDAMLAALQRPPRAGFDPRAWLGRVLGNALRMRRRAERRRQIREDRVGRERELADDDANLLEQLERQRELAASVEALPQPYRSIVLARFYRGESSAEIARRLGVSAGTVRSQLARGLSQLRERFDAREGGRRQATRALLAIAGLPRDAAATTVSTWALFQQIALMKTMTKPYTVLAAALAVLVTTFGLWNLSSDPPPHAAATPIANVDGAAGSVRDAEASLAARPDSEVARARVADVAEDERLRVRVVASETGAPLPSALVVALDEFGAPVEYRADQSGVAVLGGPLVALSAAVWAPGRVCARVFEPELASLEMLVELDRGVRLSGVVACDSPHRDLKERIELVPGADALFRDWPMALRDALRSRVVGALRGPIELDAFGGFEIDGLPTTWHGRIDAANGFQVLACEPDMACQPSGVVLPRPIENLRIELRPTQLVTGTVVWSDDGSPVDAGEVAVAVLYADGKRSYITNRALDQDGRFRAGVFPYAAPYERPKVESIRIDVHPERGEARRVVVRDSSLMSSLGPIAVHRVDPVHVLVVDSDAGGEPISGALVAGRIPRDYGTYRHHVRTDDAGRGVLRKVARDVEHITVGAVGYAVREVSVVGDRGSRTSPLEVELVRTNDVTIEVVSTNVEADSLVVRIRHDGPLFTSESTDVVRQRFLEILGLGSIDSQGVRVHWPNPDQREWRISGLVPDRPLTAEVCDGSRNVLARVAFRSPMVGESRRVRIEVTRDSIAIRGKVLASDGAAVAGARVRLEWDGSRPQWIAATRSDGTFSAEVPVAPGRVATAIFVDAPGHANLRRALPGGIAAGDLGTFYLEVGFVAEVSVRESSGREHAPQRVWARVGAEHRIDGQFRDGRRRLTGLPDHPLTVFVAFGGREYSRRFGSPPLERVVFDVPDHGTVAVELPGAIVDFYPELDDVARIRGVGDDDFEMSIRTHQPSRLELLPGKYVLVRGVSELAFEVHAGRVTRVRLPSRDR